MQALVGMVCGFAAKEASAAAAAAAARAEAPFASFRLPRTGPTALHLIPAFGSLGMNARASTRDGVRLPMGWCCEVPALLRDL